MCVVVWDCVLHVHAGSSGVEESIGSSGIGVTTVSCRVGAGNWTGSPGRTGSSSLVTWFLRQDLSPVWLDCQACLWLSRAGITGVFLQAQLFNSHWDLNLGPNTCLANILSAELSPQPLSFLSSITSVFSHPWSKFLEIRLLGHKSDSWKCREMLLAWVYDCLHKLFLLFLSEIRLEEAVLL